ncbi:MAG: heme-binding protein [Aquisalimonadaceae bacterium]
MAADVFHLNVSLPLRQARQIIDAALAEGRNRQLQPLTVVVLDVGGHLVSMDREDGSGLLRMEIAQGKAYGALGMGLGSRTLGERNKERAPFLAGVSVASDGRFVPVPGGVLMLNDQNQVVGAVGASGDSADEDEICALAGVKAAGFKAGIDAAG